MKHETSFLAAIVQKWSSTTSIRLARQLHAHILLVSAIFTGPSASPFLSNNLLSIYAKCGSLQDSQRMFDRMPQRNIVSFNALISAYSRLPHHALSAFQLLPLMINEGFTPNSLTFSSLIQASSSLEEHSLGSAMHSQVVRYGFFNGVCVQTSLLGMYSNCGDLEAANQVFSYIVDRDAIAWNSIIFGNFKNQKILEGLQLFGSMVRDGSIPTHFTYSMVLNACSRIRDCRSGKVIHAHVIKSDSPADVPLQNALLDMYSNCGETGTALYVFKNIKNPDLVSWNSMITGYSERGVGDKAMDMFIQLLRTSVERPDEYTFAAVISASGTLPASDYGKPLHAQVEKAGFQQSVFVGSTLVFMYLKNCEMDSANKLFSLVPGKDDIVWTEMITGHSKMGDGETALKYFYYMQQEGHKADSFALSSALSSCADLATLKQGEMFHTQVVKAGYHADIFVCGSLVDMYAKNGNLIAAQLVFSSSSYPDLKCWNSMLGGYSHHGKAEEAFKLFDEIVKQGLRPDEVTFVSLLSTCSHCGLVTEGKFFWNYMKENSLEPGPKHYSCMVSLLSRAGSLQEAKELILKSALSDSYPELWRILLSCSVMYKNLRIGVYAAGEVLRTEPEDSATHILLSNLYAAVGRWDAVAEIRKKIRRLMLEKDPGLSWIEIRDIIHAFSSGDQSHPHVDEARAELYRLHRNMARWETHEICCRLHTTVMGEVRGASFSPLIYEIQ
ncbi:pentatricopeptide repeat-containing protein At3g50420 [Macadamia integrifolia]|uniref:pentatricopeptide repeat-containing protein At3g50420 n=1 Tax=Macadamia integrifolia TaxID=60698 RepID=UPI001C4F8019|nr:pentatricopeptide repeat-containing protein At3g50420 [Macadamia integrifolia]